MEKVTRKESLANQAYFLLKDAIIMGNLIPGEELPEEKLATRLDISRTPLRQALTRLASEGLISLRKGLPAIVSTFTKKDSLQYMELRRVLEIYNIEKIASESDGNLISDLKQNLEQQLEAVTGNNYSAFIEIDRQFHLILASKNNNNKIKEMINEMNTKVNRAFLVLSNTLHLSAKEAYDEHMRLINALVARDKKLAKESMLHHLENVEKRFLYYFHRESN